MTIVHIQDMSVNNCDNDKIKLVANHKRYYDDCRIRSTYGRSFGMRFASEQALINQFTSIVNSTDTKYLIFTTSAYGQMLDCSGGPNISMKSVVDSLIKSYPNKVAVSNSCQVTIGEVYVAPKPTGLNRITVSMKNTYAGILVPNSGKWWGVSGVTASGYANIIMYDTALKTGSSQAINMSPDTQRVFTGNYKVFLVSTNYVSATQGGDPTATIEIIPPAGAIPTPSTITDIPGSDTGITAPIVIKIPDKDGGYTSYPFNITITGEDIPYVPPVPPIPDIIVPPTGYPKLVKVLKSLGAQTLPTAYVGQTIEVLGTVVNGPDKSKNELSFLVIDGTVVAQERTGNVSSLGDGFIAFKWKVSSGPSMRRVCILVPKSDIYPNYSESQNCVLMMTSPESISVEDRLAIERGQLKARLDMLQTERAALREGAIQSPSVSPRYEITIPTIIDVPPIKLPDEPEIPEITNGFISIPSIPTLPNELNIPIISIDNIVYGPPPLKIDVPAGKHTIKIDLKGFTPIYKSVIIGSGETVLLSGIGFV